MLLQILQRRLMEQRRNKITQDANGNGSDL
ncbi:MAG: hypothetical protein RLZZ574_842 [Cyanobacteriota bacterium]|jgi:hypothetical protein